MFARVLFSTFLLGLMGGCHGGSSVADSAPRKRDAMISLGDSLGPLREGFNAEKDRVRVVAILSPT